MVYNNLTYRFLDHSLDKDMYVDFIKSYGEASNYYINYLRNNTSFISNTDCVAVGAFDKDENLVATVSGYYKDGPNWFLINQYSKIESNSLLSAIDTHIVAMKMITLLAHKFEDLGVFNYFTRRLLKKQKQLDNTILRIENRENNYPKARYNSYHDGYYSARMPITMPGHNFWKATRADSIIVLHCLKPEERTKIMSNKFPEYKLVYK
jgi:hypothetical protein